MATTPPSRKRAAPKKAPSTSKTKTPAAPKKPAGAAVPVKAQPDWERIELDYRAGIKTLRQIADEHGITHGAINKRARRNGWERDLSGKINAKADALVSKALVSTPVSTESQIAERQVIEAAATAVADIRLAHRKDIHRARRLTNMLLDELEQQTDPNTLAMLQELGELLRREDDNGNDRRNDLYVKIISLSERSKTMKTLADSLRVVVDMERTAFGMDKEVEKQEDPLTKLLNTIAQGTGNGFKPVQHDPESPAATAPAGSSIGPSTTFVRDDDDD